jgi:hypothetical protein
MKTNILNILSLALMYMVGAPSTASAQEKKPNIVVIWGDDYRPRAEILNGRWKLPRAQPQ